MRKPLFDILLAILLLKMKQFRKKNYYCVYVSKLFCIFTASEYFNTYTTKKSHGTCMA